MTPVDSDTSVSKSVLHSNLEFPSLRNRAEREGGGADWEGGGSGSEGGREIGRAGEGGGGGGREWRRSFVL